jgi:pimeloyl-ACP methyl ester carboxylesterase
MHVLTHTDTVARGGAAARDGAARVKSVALSTGVTLQYVEHGDRSGAPVVLLHGITDSWRSFAPALPHLPSSLRAFALTQRGHGDAERPATGYRTRDFAADVAAFIEALDLGPAIIVGHSMGSTNGLRFAIDFPHHTRGLVLIGAFATYQHNPDMTHFWNSTVALLTDPIDPAFVREFQESTLAIEVPREIVDTAVEESLKVPARIWRAALGGCLEDDFVDEIGKITAPTLALWGDRDALVPRVDQDVLLKRIAGSRLVIYHGHGHAPHWEDPARFAADIGAFAKELT